MSAPHNVYRDGEIHVLSEKCATCIFRPDARFVPGSRVAEMVRNTKDNPGATVPCHDALWSPDTDDAICRGWWDRLADSDPVLQLAKAMDIVVFDDPPVHPIGEKKWVTS